jgi:hypothetical protein
MELVAGYPFWFIKSGLPYQYPKLLENVKCQAAIIGGGISGALTAYHLINAGIECILVDGRTIGLGCTCASILYYSMNWIFLFTNDLLKNAAYILCPWFWR